MADFTKPALPESVTKEGTAKRNIIRKGAGGVSRKAGKAVDDGSLNPVSGAIDKGDPNYDSEDDGYAGFQAATINRPRYTRAYNEVSCTFLISFD